MKVIETGIPDVKVLIPSRFDDVRGFLSETYRRSALAEAGVDMEFVQENDSLSTRKGTVRGLHLQIPPRAQAKIVRVVRGAIFDVAVDVRRGSPTFGRHVAVEITADQRNQLVVPAGFAHGFCTLEPNTHVVYKMTDYYAPDHERGIRWDDPALAIPWPVSAGDAVLSERDHSLPPLSEVTELFE